jgi:hypothetical protein
MTQPSINIHARCPLHHDHCVPMDPIFQVWLDARKGSELRFEISRCPWGVVLEPVAGTICPHCDRRMFERQFCCAFPLEDS